MEHAQPGVVRVEHPRCPFCHEQASGTTPRTGCPRCLAWSHDACLREGGERCAACGGELGRRAPPRAPAAREKNPLHGFGNDLADDLGQGLVRVLDPTTARGRRLRGLGLVLMGLVALAMVVVMIVAAPTLKDALVVAGAALGLAVFGVAAWWHEAARRRRPRDRVYRLTDADDESGPTG